MSQGSEELAGRTLGDFVVRHRIGEGGFGEVYRAEQPALGREAVIKVLHARHRASKTVIQRFLREARLASRLDHPYAAHIYAFGVETDGLMWIAMEYVKGQTLHDLLRQKGPMSIDTLVPLLERICEVLQAAHDLGIVHRDIKPPNVMVVSRSNRLFPKLLDFGIAKVNADDVASAPASGSMPAVLVPGADPAPASKTPLAPTPDPTMPLVAYVRPALADPPSPSPSPSPAEPAPSPSDKTVSFAGMPGGAVGLQMGNAIARPRRPSKGPGLAATLEARGAVDADAPVLTEAGATMGSPPYMAPEQWDDSAAATARTDLYALGIVVYEALTGRRPFAGATLTALATEHASAPVPPLGAPLPVALDAVMAKVLAKDAADRYASAMQFAQELRAAAGLGALSLPALDEELRISVETSFPQPIAEAVAAFHAARNTHQARDALRDITTTAVRYVALVALAAYSQVKPADSGVSEAVAATLRDLRRRVLTDEEWLAFARILAQPFAENRAAHPVPELVALLLPGGDPTKRKRAATAAGVVDAPADLLTSVVGAEHTDPDVLANVRSMLADAVRLLRGLVFLADYPLVVVDNQRAESWMGLRRPKRIAVELFARVVEPGQPVLVDATNRPLVSLWPLLQTSSPQVGAAPELFLLDGRGRRGARLVALPQALERHDEGVWEWLGERFAAREGDKGVSSDSNETSPFRGLASFTTEHADAFVGREREIEAAVNRLRVAPLVAVVGPSGAGKSSFVHAGILPSLPETWTTITVRPGATPIAALEARLRRAGFPVTDLAATLAANPRALGQLLDAAPTTTVLVIDQFEELFTLGAPVADQRLYVRALLTAAQSGDDRVRLILTLRDDFLARAIQLPELRERLPTALFLLGTPAAAELLRILVEPLARRGFQLEDPAFADRMVRDVEGTPGALALLSFTAQKLWELRDRHFRQLTRRAYDALGGVSGALAQHAEATLATMTTGEQRLARVALGHLVTAEGTRAVLSRTELQQLVDDPAGTSVLEKLIAARLLTATEAEGGDDSIELVHEALLVAWPRLAEWRREDAEGARLRDQVRAAARQWSERERPRGLLWRDDALAELTVWRGRHPQKMTEVDEAFIAASLAEARRGRRYRSGAIVAALVLMAIAVAVLVWGRDQAQKQRAAAQEAEARQRDLAVREHERLLSGQLEAARQSVLAGHAAEARQALAAAGQGGAEDTPSVRFLRALALQPLATRITALDDHAKGLVAAELDHAGTRALTANADGNARLWDLASGAIAMTLAGCPGRLTGAGFDPQGDRIATECNDGVVRLYAATGAFQRAFVTTDDKTGEVAVFAAFSPDGARLATLAHATLVLWDLATGAKLWTATSADADGRALGFARDGRTIATSGTGGSTRLFSAATGHLEHELASGYAPTLEFSLASDLLLTAGWQHRTAQLWNRKDGRLVRTLAGHSGWVDIARFSPDGATIATAARDHTVRMWDAATGELRSSRSVGAGTVKFLAFDPHGKMLAAALSDGTAIVWDVASGTPLCTLEGHGATVQSVAFDAAGERAITASDDGTAILWRPARGGVHAILPHPGLLGATIVEHTVYTYGDRKDVRAWDETTGILRASVTLPTTVEVGSAARDGHLVFGCDDGDVYDWDGRASAPRKLAHHKGIVRALAVSPDGALVASGADDDEVFVTTRATGAHVALPGHAGYSSALAFTADGTQLATSDGQGHIWTWTATGQRLATFTGHADWIARLAFARDGRLVSTSGDSTVRVWAADGKALAVLRGHTNLVNGLAIDPTNTRILTTSLDNTARIWTLATGALERTLPHASSVFGGVFSPDGALVVTGGDDGVVHVWDVATGNELDRFEAHTATVWMLGIDPAAGLTYTAGLDGSVVLWELPVTPAAAPNAAGTGDPTPAR